MKLSQLQCPACGANVADSVVLNQQFQCSACRSILVLTDLVAADQTLCPQCKTVNSHSNRFCLRCGEILQQACPFCHATNSIDSDHCRVCGVNLTTARQHKDQWLAQERQHVAARAAALQQVQAETRSTQLNQWIEDLKEPENHPWAIYCLNRLGSVAVEPLINTLRNNPDPDARFGAAHALGNMADPQAIPALRQALADPTAVVRYWAIDALMRLQAVTAVADIARLLSDPHEGVRTHAKTALGQLGQPAKSWWSWTG